MDAVSVAAQACGLQEPVTVTHADSDSSYPPRPSISPVSSPQVRPVTSFDNSSQSSTTSQQSRPAPLQLSASDVSSSALPAASPLDLTPPSSAASPTRGGHDASPDSLTPRKATDLVNGGPSQRLSPTRHARTGSTAGAKRTASGQVKSTSHAEASPALQIDTNRTRASSSASTASTGNVVEISQQLRTKLKYAMVKVQNGWQSHSLDELESIASASPRSTVSGFPTDSPRRQIQPRAIRKWSDSSSSESSRSDTHYLPHARMSAAVTPTLGPPPTRGLAPPADIVSGGRRRPSPNDPAHTRGTSHDLRWAVRPTGQRTPSQNAAMEADAVETLLFMASPNNSGYHPASQSSQVSSLRASQPLSAMTSPLRTQFSQASVNSLKKVAFTDQHASTSTSLQKSAMIDRMLDDLPDETEDDLDEALALADRRAAEVAM